MVVYLIFFITKDVDDPVESEKSNLFMTIGSATELAMKFVAAYYGWNNKRRRTISIGLVLLAVCMGVIATFEYLGNWNALKYTPPGVFIITGILITAPFMGSLAEKFPSPIIGIIQGSSTILASVFDFIFPLLKVKADDNSRLFMWSSIIGGISLIGALTNYFVTFECQGLTKAEIRRKFYEKKVK